MQVYKRLKISIIILNMKLNIRPVTVLDKKWAQII